MRLLLTLALVMAGHFSDALTSVVLVNHTGLKIVRIEIDDRKYEETSTQRADQILVSVKPGKHDMKLVFKGGGHIEWPAFDFKGVHQITFERVQNRINARYE